MRREGQLLAPHRVEPFRGALTGARHASPLISGGTSDARSCAMPSALTPAPQSQSPHRTRKMHNVHNHETTGQRRRDHRINNIVQASTSAVPIITPSTTNAFSSSSPLNLFDSANGWFRLEAVACGRGGTTIRLTIPGTLSARVQASRPSRHTKTRAQSLLRDSRDTKPFEGSGSTRSSIFRIKPSISHADIKDRERPAAGAVSS